MKTLHESDEHAPFAHYFIKTPGRIRTKSVRGKPDIITEIPAVEYIVCYFCGHWINRPLEQCKCPASCHAEALSGVIN
jgi:hypothetical protein